MIPVAESAAPLFQTKAGVTPGIVATAEGTDQLQGCFEWSSSFSPGSSCDPRTCPARTAEGSLGPPIGVDLDLDS